MSRPAGRPDDTLNCMHADNNQDRTWPSPAADGPVSARVRLPASKSITNRALFLADVWAAMLGPES